MSGESHPAQPQKSPDEEVALVDREGTEVGSAPRALVRRDNLLHSSTAVLVRSPTARIYVHRRTDTKDWAPGCWDAAAGGVLRTGEQPALSAVRELAEELGITCTSVEPLGTHLYEDETTRCFEHAYEASWDGPVVHQAAEVAEGGWMTLTELATLLADPARPFVPDTRQLLSRLADAGVRDYGTLR